MNWHVLTRPALLAALIVGANAAAYEYENAVPLTLGLEAGKAAVDTVAVKLEGRDVSIVATLRNGEARAQQIGWYASTPHFGLLGEGEEHLDKSFSEVSARFDGRAVKPAVYRRGYFMGRDITRELSQAGLAPLPDLQADAQKLARLPTVQGLRFDQWQGYVAYSWHAAVAPHASAEVEVRYRALPQFALTELDSAAFDQAVLQHCGNPDAIRRHLRQLAVEPAQVMIERYVIPLAFLPMGEVQLAIAQPKANWQQAHPAVSLACGLANPGLAASVSGSVSNANFGLSVLVVSSLAGQAAVAGAAAFDYQLGATRVSEDQHRIVIHAQPDISVALLPGGRAWPALSLDEAGGIYVGGTVIDGATGRVVAHADAALALPHGVELAVQDGRYRFRRGGKECRLSPQQLHLDGKKSALDALKDANLALASSNDALLALATRFGPDGAVAGYVVQRIDIDHCQVALQQRLGNPDLLVELAHSARGGWWITGSVEQTLLRSSDGLRWSKVSLPVGLSSLVSSYVVNEREIWLAAVLSEVDGPSPYLLVYSGDGGGRWRNLLADDPLLAKLPTAWLEGQKRRTP